MRLLTTIGLLFLSLFCVAQRTRDFSAVDNYVYSIKPEAPKELAQKLTGPFSTNLEKVRAIFRWITIHISYGTGFSKMRNYKDNDDDTSSVLKSLDERVAEKVLQRQLAVCDGYARLFKTLCDDAGIKAQVITGYSRTDRNQVSNRFSTNHTWNAVYVDSAWQLLDVTWASGYFSYYGSNYVQHLDDYYFLTSPEEFIKDHYPEDPRWTLLPQLPMLAEYHNTPFKPAGFVRSRIKSFYPIKGVIDAAIGDSITIVLETDDKEKALLVVDTLYDEEHAYDSLKAYMPKPVIIGKKINYTYVVKNNEAEWLNVILNDRNILRYKLNIQKKEIEGTSMK